MRTSTTAAIALTFVAATALAACGTVSRNVANDGRGADQIVFPDMASAILQGGTFVNLDNLRQVAPGMSKDQLYDLLGRPHFHEGAFGVREWDYIFDFRTGNGDEFVSCQYKVLFDRQLLAQSFHWKPTACAERLVSRSPPTPAPVVAQPRTLSLSADALFAFDSAVLSDAGQRRLDVLVAELDAAGTPTSISITGHSDRIGSDHYNLELSQRRARSVADYLIAHGLPTTAVSAHGHGEREPLSDCHQASRDALIACLAPDRRVEIEIELK